MGSLLAAESLSQGNWLKLDHYPTLVKEVLDSRLEVIGGHLYYFFPIGTSLLVTPVVALLGFLQVDVVTNDDKIQIALAALAAAATCLLAYGLARRFIGHWSALLLTAAFWFGSSLASTGATALWSHNFAAVFSLSALLALVCGLERYRTSYVVVSGVFAAGAVVIRPQLMILALGIGVLLVLRWRNALFAYTCSLLILGFGFGIFSRATLGVWVPTYYLPGRLDSGFSWEALLGTVMSPGRGLLVFTPFLIVTVFFVLLVPLRTQNEWGLVALGLAWPVCHWVLVSRFWHWWGGWGYGPRLMMDVLPGLLLVTAVLWPRSTETVRAKASVITFALLALVSIWIHTVQGLYNPYTRFWYIQPNIDSTPEIVWDWSYPQFMASESRHEDREENRLPVLPPLQRGMEYGPKAPELGFVGWSTGFWSPGISLDGFRLGSPPWVSEDERRWTEGHRARIVFEMDESSVPEAGGRFALHLDTYGPQEIHASVNGVAVSTSLTEAAGEEIREARLSLAIKPNLLREGRNELVFLLPGAATVGQVTEFRQIAFALKKLVLQ